MEPWLVILVTVGLLVVLIKLLLGFFAGPSYKLPPSVPALSLARSMLWHITSISKLLPFIQSLHAKYGPMVTLRLGSHPAIIMLSDRTHIHHVLVKNSTTFTNRSSTPIITKQPLTSITTLNGNLWQFLRRNMIGAMVRPVVVEPSFSVQRWAFNVMRDRLKAAAGPKTPVQVLDHIKYCFQSVQMTLCFGVRLEEQKIMELPEAWEELQISLLQLGVFMNFWPAIGDFLFPQRWKRVHHAREKLDKVVLPLIRSRSEARGKLKGENIKGSDIGELNMCYLDTLLDLKLPPEEGNRKLTEAEMVGLCGEWVSAGSETTILVLNWVMACLVKHPEVQKKLYDEIRAVIGPNAVAVEKEHLPKIPYLKAVILETMRRYPPGNVLLPHAATQDTELGGYRIPKDTTVGIVLAEMGWDPEVWEDPMTYRPERFLGDEGFDLTGTRELKMIPFGAGRRMCPGYALGMMHLEYFTANLVWAFEWKSRDGHDVDLSHMQMFIFRAMKNPLQAILIPRL